MDIEIKRDGLTLRGILTKPETSKFDLAILFHGFRGNKNDPFLLEIAKNLQDQGIATLHFDFAGLGDSDGSFTNMTVLGELLDANKILQYAESIPNVQNIYLVGHSQGGVVASMMAGYYPDRISKLALLSPAATLVDDANKGQLQMANYDPNNVPDEIPLINDFVAGGFYVRTAKTLPIYEVAQHYEGPVLLVHAGNDQVVNEIASERYHAVYKNSSLHIIPGADHSFYEKDYGQQAAELVSKFLNK